MIQRKRLKTTFCIVPLAVKENKKDKMLESEVCKREPVECARPAAL